MYLRTHVYHGDVILIQLVVRAIYSKHLSYVNHNMVTTTKPNTSKIICSCMHIYQCIMIYLLCGLNRSTSHTVVTFVQT